MVRSEGARVINRIDLRQSQDVIRFRPVRPLPTRYSLGRGAVSWIQIRFTSDFQKWFIFEKFNLDIGRGGGGGGVFFKS